MTRAQKVAKAQELRAQGLMYREIASRMRVSTSSVSTYLNDPDLSRQRLNRERYAGSCEVCGAPTDGSNGADQAPKMCCPCANHAREVWTREAIVWAIKRWARKYGKPPTATDWNSAQARAYRRPAQAKRYESGNWPNFGTVQNKFGSWANGIEAAGFPRPMVGKYERRAA